MSYKPPQCKKCHSKAFSFNWPSKDICRYCLEKGKNWGKDRAKMPNSEKFFRVMK